MIWGFHGGGYELRRLLAYKNPVRTPQETHYTSDRELSRLMLCKIWGSHDGDCKECSLLVQEKPVRTSQETQYFSARELSRLILCQIWGFHGGDCEECPLVGCDAVTVVRTDVPPKCRFLQGPHGVTSHKTVFFIFNIVNTLDQKILFRLLLRWAKCWKETRILFSYEHFTELAPSKSQREIFIEDTPFVVPFAVSLYYTSRNQRNQMNIYYYYYQVK
jgi:hypothetical protein